MIGHPKFTRGQKVKLTLPLLKGKKGIIWVVDPYGSFGQNEEVSYDIYVKKNNMLYKHIRESFVKACKDK